MNRKKQKRKTSRRQKRREAQDHYETRSAHRAEMRARKVERKAEREKKIVVALMSYRSPEQEFIDSGVDYAIKRIVRDRAGKLMDKRVRGALETLGNMRGDWVRPIIDWKPKGKSPTSLFHSLVKYLLVKYTMPDFLYSVFFIEEDRTRRIGIGLFKHLAAGGSLYRVANTRVFPVPLTKRMCHVFMQSTSRLGLVSAARHAQVLVHGGDRRLAEAISAERHLNFFNLNESWWNEIILWTCNQGMLAPSRVSPIYDYLANRGMEGHDANFTMKGRTALSVLKGVEEWHGQLARQRKINGESYEPSGFDSWYYERKVKFHPQSEGFRLEKHCVTEIGTSKELASEGRKLRHCVWSYGRDIKSGHVSIWSYKVESERVLTIEVDNRNKRVVQVRGKLNCKPTRSQMSFVERWMAKNNLIKASWLPVV